MTTALELIFDAATRWGSTFSMLARAERLQTVRLLVLYQFERLTGVYSS